MQRPPAPPEETLIGTSASKSASVSFSSAAASPVSAGPAPASASASGTETSSRTWPEIQARFEAMLKDPTQRSRIQKAMPALEQDELPADEDERKICAQLHESVAKTGNAAYIKEMNEETAIRFCRGYVFGSYKKEKLTREVAIQKTIDVLHKCLEWRVQRDVSTLCERDMPKRHLYKKLWVNGVSGVDKNGRQIWVLHTPSKKIMTQLTGEELLLNHFKDFENLARRKTEHALKRGYPSFKHVAILDLGQESMALKVVQYMQKTLTFLPKGSKEPMPIHQSFYPECMKTLWIINTPLVFKAIYTAVKAFIHPVTREKFRILGSDYLQKMAEEGISKDALPKYLGGTGPDPEGFHYKVSREYCDTQIVCHPLRQLHSICTEKSVTLYSLSPADQGVRRQGRGDQNGRSPW